LARVWSAPRPKPVRTPSTVIMVMVMVSVMVVMMPDVTRFSIETMMLEPVLRMTAFSVVYGAVMVKMISFEQTLISVVSGAQDSQGAISDFGSLAELTLFLGMGLTSSLNDSSLRNVRQCRSNWYMDTHSFDLPHKFSPGSPTPTSATTHERSVGQVDRR
jgi:hypothetical protein